MTQQKSPSTPSSNHRFALFISEFIDRVVFFAKAIDELGKFLLGSWWRQVISSVQDAIGIGFLLWLPARIIEVISGKSFSTIENCFQDTSGPSSIACIATIASDYSCWIIYFGRVISRFIRQVLNKETYK